MQKFGMKEVEGGAICFQPRTNFEGDPQQERSGEVEEVDLVWKLAVRKLLGQA
jgi:hypothetical protein